jgi:hypothetical protein
MKQKPKRKQDKKEKEIRNLEENCNTSYIAGPHRLRGLHH